MIENLTSLTRTFFDRMNISLDALTIQEQDDAYYIDIKTPDSALLIGMHGQNLLPLTHILSRILEGSHGSHLMIHLEVNDYVKERDAKFYRYLDGRIEMVMKSGKDVIIPNLNAYERKKAHDYISSKSIAGLRTHSQGEGTGRVLHIASDGIINPENDIKKQDNLESLISEDGVGI